MRNKRSGLVFLVCFLLILLNACAYTQHSLSFDNGLYKEPAPSDNICIMLPPNIAHGSKVYFSWERSDPEKTIADRVFSAVHSVHPSSMLITTANEDHAIQQCFSRGAKYLLSPRVLHWQGRASGWSFMRNVIKIETRLIQLEPKVFVKSAFFEARDGWFNLGSVDPADLLLNDSFARSIAELIN